jgi:predicted nucleic acid-binding protein
MNYLVDTNFLLRLAQNTSPFQQYVANAYSSLRSRYSIITTLKLRLGNRAL